VQSTGEAGGYYRLYLDDRLVLDDWSMAKALVGSSTISLSARPHQIVLEHHGRPGFLGTRFRLGIVRHGDYVDPDAEKIAAAADAAIVAVGFDPDSESEGADRTFQLPPGQDELIEKIAAANKHTIVVVTSGGSVDMNDWLDQVPALIEAWYSGQEGGTALAQILFGGVDPSGRLPVSFEKHWEDNPVHDSYYPEGGSTRLVYKEGVFVGYRGYERSGIKPRFPFGYGLSYTTFRYRNLSIHAIPAGAQASGSSPRYEVSCDVTNTGKRDGADVAEVYVGEVHPPLPRPVKELKGFARVSLNPGETKRVKVALDDRAFAYYDVHTHQWRVDPGKFTIFVGRSVDEIQLTGTISLEASRLVAGNITARAHHSPRESNE
jgi:beta-glucosidase